MARASKGLDLSPQRLWAPALRGLALFAQKIPQLVMFALTLASLVYLGIGVGLFLLPLTVAGLRLLANRSRRLAHAWSGVSIPEPYRPEPEPEPGLIGRVRRVQWILTDPATWRDMLWAIADPAVGGFLALLPAALLVYGLEGLVFPFLWDTLTAAGYNDWYGPIHVHGASSAQSWLTVPFGLAVLALGLWAGPRLLTAHALFTRTLLGPAPGTELAQRVRHLTETRSVAVDSQAAELRRIERDLHDGAQARLVAMGMHLGAAESLMATNPEAARALLAEARESSSKALGELRDLVRGIHPPVLSDRGLGDAVRALALDIPLPVEVTVEVPGRLSDPVESAAYFAVSELLANVAKHAEAQRAWVDLRHDGETLRMSVTDDGSGGADASGGSGLHGIERRLSAFDGILALNSPVGGPTMVTMEIPCVLSSPKTSSF
ncbi:sensor histidine kinase [Streptomyces sp. UNOC14_S4]|uniref:sensor histidine kinase n=1 Tax=Streptomyces sp. UNOC14_S4 TaxID=2872340 RepID=UPI001E2A7901|nr:sensor histidine kinase [Streptomyces sp. UNOC14_S4]